MTYGPVGELLYVVGITIAIFMVALTCRELVRHWRQ